MLPQAGQCGENRFIPNAPKMKSAWMDQRSNIPETVTLEIPPGRLVGLRSGDVCEFRGIPFAKPPIEKLRWCMPEPAEAWAGVRDATHFAAVSPQAPTPFDSLLGGSLSLQSEDCLYLNVWTPGHEGGLWPVMVWVHGGAFVIGSGSQSIYNGARLAALGVVVVTLNYRLGALGFMSLARATDARVPGTGVVGLADQLLTLDWIKRNISVFGGDPDNVTIFGESAGAMSIAALLASPLASGQFHRAVVQSGNPYIGHTSEHSQRLAHAFLGALSIDRDDAWRLSQLPVTALLKAQTAVIASAHNGKDLQRLGRLPFQPAIGGSLLPLRPLEAIRQGSARGIPLLCGTTRDEWKLFTAVDPRMRLMSASQFDRRLERTAGEAAPLLQSVYAEGSPFERFNAFMTDRMFAVPTARLAEAQSNFAPVYSYRFDWRSKLLGGMFGACHALDLGFVFGTHAAGPASIFFGKGAEADSLANAMMDCWVAFASTGDPSTGSSGVWPRHHPGQQATMIFGDDPPHLGSAADLDRLDAWDAVPDYRLEP